MGVLREDVLTMVENFAKDGKLCSTSREHWGKVCHIRAKAECRKKVSWDTLANRAAYTEKYCVAPFASLFWGDVVMFAGCHTELRPWHERKICYVVDEQHFSVSLNTVAKCAEIYITARKHNILNLGIALPLLCPF